MKNIITLSILLLIFLLSGCSADRQGKMQNEGSLTNGDGMIKNVENAGDKDDMTPGAFVVLRVGDSFFTVEMDGNPSADTFHEKLKKEDITVEMHDNGGIEKTGDLPWTLPKNDEEIAAQPGDLILYQGNKLTVYYDENTCNATKLGKLNAEEDEIRAAFGGKDDITAEIFLEWTE